MKVKILQTFIGNIDGEKYRGQVGDVIDIPANTGWVEAGFVEPVATKITKRRGRTKKAAS